MKGSCFSFFRCTYRPPYKKFFLVSQLNLKLKVFIFSITYAQIHTQTLKFKTMISIVLTRYKLQFILKTL